MNKIFKSLFGLIVMFSFMITINAASASIKVSSGTSQIVVGKTFTVTVKVSSGAALGSWEYSLNYDTGKFKLESGENPVADVANNGSTKSKSYTYKFKAVGTGTGSIGVKSVGVIGWDENKMSVSTSSKSVKVITQAQLEASYSKDNYLKSLSVDGLKLTPAFKKDVMEYRAEANANTTTVNIKASVNDKKSKVSGTGKHNVGEGENKFNITVKAQNGSTRTYKVIINVIDPNPITVNIDGQDLTVVKRESSLEAPEGFEKTTVKINDIDIPAFYNGTNDYTLVGLKGPEETNLYIYDAEANTYQKYYEIELNSLNLYPLEIDRDFGSDYTPSTATVGEKVFNTLQLTGSDYHLLYARNLDTGENNYYLYDMVTNTAIRYREEKKQVIENKKAENKDSDYKNMIIILTAGCALMMLTTLFALLSKSKTKKEYKKILTAIKEKQRESEEKKKEKEIKEVNEVLEDENKDVKPKKTKKTNKK